VGGPVGGRGVKVAMLSHTASPHAPTGAERSLALLAGGLASRGHEVAVVAPGPWSLADGLTGAGVEVVTIATRACWLVQWQRQPVVRQAWRWLRFVAPDPGRRRLAAWLDGFGPDVVHVNCLPHLGGAAAAATLGLPVVWHVREMLPDSPRRAWWAQRVRRYATAVVAVSGAVAEWLADAGVGDRTTVVHNGVDPPSDPPDRAVARDRFGLDDHEVAVGFVGQVIEHKGVLELVSAVLRLRREGVPVTALIAGTGPDGYRSLVEAAAGADPGAVRWLGPVDSPWDVLAASDVVAVPTVWPDPLPRAVLEAMAAGRPVVASAAGGIPEMIENGVQGTLTPPGDVEALAAALERLVRDPEARERMGAAARERVQARFTVDRHVDRVERVLLRVSREDRA